MATIPIEVVLQDAESPVEPTPTPEEETDIAVPETGIISNGNGGSNNGIGSAASIILPAIIAVLAISAMVAIIVRRYQKRKSNTEATKLSRKEKLATVASSTIAILAATVLVGNLVIPATKAASDETDGGNDANEGTYLETEDKVTIVATIDKDSKEPTIVNVKDTLYATTDASGYTVTMSMIEDALTSNLYLNGDETSEYYIAPVENARLGDNTWGYRLNEEDEDYLPVPLADKPATVAEGETAVEHEEINVYYTVKANNELPLGTYSGEIEYNITPVNPIDKLTYMQDFVTLSAEDKAKLLTSMPEGEQYILKDKRDEKPYYISKLADGNVWMTQNLDLELSTEKTLTPADTDVSEDWTPVNSTIAFTGTTVEGWQNDNNTPYSADPGDVYYYTSGTDADDIKYDSLEECEAEHSDGTCQHYHAGNYYNWSAAVASNDTLEMTERFSNAPDSICPAGWRLPQGIISISEYGDFDNLIGSYNTIADEQHPCGGLTCKFYSYASGGFNGIRSQPLWLVRSGCTGAQLDHAAKNGYYSSSTVSDGTDSNIYHNFGVSSVWTESSVIRGSGNSIRCLAR